MSSGLIPCQKCGEENHCANWVKGEFKSFDKVKCKKCGFIIYDEEKDYFTREKEIKQGK